MNRLMSVLSGEFLRLLDGFLCFLGEFVKSEWHCLFSFLEITRRDFSDGRVKPRPLMPDAALLFCGVGLDWFSRAVGDIAL